MQIQGYVSAQKAWNVLVLHALRPGVDGSRYVSTPLFYTYAQRRSGHPFLVLNMKKRIWVIASTVLLPILSNHKFFRRKKGGKWYKVCIHDGGGFISPMEIWTQKHLIEDEDSYIIEKEEYL
jgi:hypothetical protein